jgi:hypothetical protein
MTFEWNNAAEGVHYAFYGLLAVLSIGEVFRTFLSGKIWSEETRDRRLVLYPLLLLASAARIAWVQQKSNEASDASRSPEEDHDLGFIFCRLASALFFCFLLAVVYSWYRIADTTHNPARVQIAKQTFVLVGVGSFVVQGLLTGAYVLSPDSKKTGYGNIAYEASMWTTIVLTAFLSVAFLIFGIQIVRGVSESEQHMAKSKSDSNSLRNVGAKILSVAISIGISGAIRIVVYSYKPLTDKDLPGNFFYPWCFYFIPEVLPTLMFLITSPSSVINSALRSLIRGVPASNDLEAQEKDTQRPLMGK